MRRLPRCGIGPCQKRDAAYSPVRGYYSEGEYRIGAASDPALYYGIDQIGSVRRVFENTSSAPAYDYDPWGNALQTTAPLADYGFAGMFNHAPSRRGRTWFRAYDPNVGRWLSRDPLNSLSDTQELYQRALIMTDAPSRAFRWTLSSTADRRACSRRCSIDRRCRRSP